MGGIDEEIRDEEKQADIIVMKAEKPKRRPFHYWKVGERELQLKLKASMIEKVERKYNNTNILSLVFDGDGVPALSVMLTIIQAAAIPWTHNLDYSDVVDLYDKWTEEGGDQTTLFRTVLMPTLAVSGFFTEKQASEILKEVAASTDL